MVRVNKKRLDNHPERQHITLYGDICYVELGIVYKKYTKNSIVSNTSRDYKRLDGVVSLTGCAIVLAISENSTMFNNGIRVGDTIIISKDVELNDNLTLDSQPVYNPFSALYTFKTLDQVKTYESYENNGPTCIIDGFKCIGKLLDSAPEEIYEPIVSSKIILPNAKIIK